MTYEEFILKWANRNLYSSDQDVYGKTVGSISYNQCDFGEYETDLLNVITKTDVFYTPNLIAWRDEKQRREFYKDCKMVGVRRKKGTKNEWYKIVDIK